MKRFFFPLILMMLVAACGNQQQANTAQNSNIDSLAIALEGDSTIYGLACDGSTDTILVFLPITNIAADPDTLNILNATRQRCVFGRVKVGDQIAVVRNGNDSTVADFVVDIENLRGTWCYQVMPSLHVRADMVGRTERQMVNALPDSVRELLSTPREYTMQFKGDHTVMSLESFKKLTEEEEQFIDYPKTKRYGQWNLFNGKLLLTEVAMDSSGVNHALSIDTVTFVLMDRDTLVLRFKDQIRNYYPKR